MFDLIVNGLDFESTDVGRITDDHVDRLAARGKCVEQISLKQLDFFIRRGAFPRLPGPPPVPPRKYRLRRSCNV